MCRMVRDGHFGFKDYFESLCDKVEGNDFYLLGSDFESYLEAQVMCLCFLGSLKPTRIYAHFGVHNLIWCMVFESV